MPTRLRELAPDHFATAARRVMARCDELARVTATPGEIERVYLSPEHARVNRLAGETQRLDEVVGGCAASAGDQYGSHPHLHVSGGPSAHPRRPSLWPPGDETVFPAFEGG